MESLYVALMLVALLFLMPFASIAAVLFTSALPEIASVFQIGEFAANASVMLFLIGFALGNLPYGPIAKRYGRKYAIFCGLFLTLVGCLLILVAGVWVSWALFLLGRLISALGSSVGMQIAFTIMGDVYGGARLTRVVSITSLSFALAPGLSITLGGFLTDTFGWQSCFYALIAYCLLLAVLCWRIPETAPRLDSDALNVEKIGKAFLHKLKNRRLVYCSLLLGVTTAMCYLFATAAPFIVIKQMKMSPTTYGLLSSVPPLGLLVGGIVTLMLSQKERSRMVKYGAWIILAVSVGSWVLFSLFNVGPFLLFFPVPILYFGIALIFNNASAIVLDDAHDKSNSSAVMNFLNMGVAALVVLFSGSVQTSQMMATGFCLLAFITFVLQLKLNPS